MIENRARLLERLAALAENRSAVELVASLVHGSRATYTVAEAAELLSVSAKHLYANISATGLAAPGVEVLRSGDRITVPAHLLRSRIGLPDPHRAPPPTEPITLEHLPPELLARLADTISHTIMCRLEASGLIETPPTDPARPRIY